MTHKLQILLREAWRHDEGVRLVQDRLRAIGCTPTAAGHVTVSAECPPDVFHQVFGPTASPHDESLPVPHALAQYVESIAVAPPHVRMDQKTKE
jgi:hypothetical protein